MKERGIDDGHIFHVSRFDKQFLIQNFIRHICPYRIEFHNKCALPFFYVRNIFKLEHMYFGVLDENGKSCFQKPQSRLLLLIAIMHEH